MDVEVGMWRWACGGERVNVNTAYGHRCYIVW